MINTWRCQACGKERPDECISVHTFAWRDSKGKIIPGGEVNFKYCNDNIKCFEKAKIAEKKGRAW
jgi:hypothetical protein